MGKQQAGKEQTDAPKYRSVGKVRLEAGCSDGVIFAPDSDHLATDRGQRFAVFFPADKEAGYLVFDKDKDKVQRLAVTCLLDDVDLKGLPFALEKSDDRIFHAALAAAKCQLKVVIVVDACLTVIERITVPAE